MQTLLELQVTTVCDLPTLEATVLAEALKFLVVVRRAAKAFLIIIIIPVFLVVFRKVCWLR